MRPPILFIHGAHHGAWCWQEYWLPFFGEHGWDAHTVSLRAHDTAPGDIRRARIRDYVADVAAAVRDLGTPPILIGHSMGGFIVQKYLERAHLPARAAVLVASVPDRGAAGLVVREWLADPLSVTRDLLTRRIHTTIATVAKMRQGFFPDDLPETDLRRYHTQMVDESALAILDFTLFDLPSAAAVRGRDLPLFVLAAQDDRLFSVREQAGTALAYGADFHAAPGAHDLMLDPVGWQVGAQSILDWLEQKGLARDEVPPRLHLAD